MQKIPHTYTDYDGSTVHEDLYFHLETIKLAENLGVIKEYEDLEKITQEERRELTPDEIARVIGLIKALFKLSYGMREEKFGRQTFRQDEEVWDSFEQSRVYNSFFFWLFQDTTRANKFMADIMPAELREEAIQMAAAQGQDIATYVPPTEIQPEPTASVGGRPKRVVPTQEELLEKWRNSEEGRAAMAQQAAEEGEG